MNRDDKLARKLAYIDLARREALESMSREQEKLDRKFDRLQQQILQRYGQPSDTQRRIINAALDLLKADGLENLTLRKLARMLNMQAPGLYWHFKSKESLVDFLAEAILQAEFTDITPRAKDEPWQDWLMGHMKRLRKAMLAYPDGARVVAGAHLYPAVTLARISEVALESLVSAGLDIQTAHHIVLTAINFTFGHSIEEQAAPSPEQLTEINLDQFLKPFPYIRQAIALDNPDEDEKDDFTTGLQYIMRGAEVSGT